MTTAADAIARSISHTEIVTLSFDAERNEKIDAMHVKGDLLNASEDWVESGSVTEYWGKDDDGNEWRVHVRES